MHAVVLVGGFGTRLRPLTATTPKSMLTVGNEEIITRLVHRLGAGGVEVVTLALGFLPDPFLEAFPDGRLGDVEVRYAVEPQPLDTAGAIRFAATTTGVDGTFLVLNGDVITDLDIAALVDRHHDRNAEATLHLTAVTDPSAYGVVELSADDRILRFVEKPPAGTAPSDLINAGTYVLESSVLDLIEPDVPVSVERMTFPQLVERGRIFGAPTDDYWIDVGRPATLLQANLDRLAGRFDRDVDHPVTGGHGVDRAAAVAVTATIVDSVVAAETIIGERASLTRSVVLRGARIGDGAVVQDSIVMGSVGDGARIDRVTVGAAGRVPSGAVLSSVLVPEPA